MFGDYWGLFIALSGENASVSASTPTPTINFTFYLLDKHLYKLAVGSWCRTDPRRLSKSHVVPEGSVFSPPGCYLIGGQFLSLLPGFLSEFLISLRWGSFSSFGWMTSLVQWTRRRAWGPSPTARLRHQATHHKSPLLQNGFLGSIEMTCFCQFVWN